MVTLFSKITDSEVEVMRVLWEAEEPLPMANIRKKLEQSSEWHFCGTRRNFVK